MQLAVHNSTLHVRARHTINCLTQMSEGEITHLKGPQLPWLVPAMPSTLRCLPSFLKHLHCCQASLVFQVCVCARQRRCCVELLKGGSCVVTLCVCARACTCRVLIGISGTLPELSMPVFTIPPWWRLVGRQLRDC